MTRHHVVPKSREREGYNVHHPKNIKLLRQKYHDALHRLFSNKTPNEQLEDWYSVNKEVLSDAVKNAIVELLEMKKEEFYKQRMSR